MKNIELLNVCYKYFNRFISTLELVEKLENIDKNNLSKKDIKEIDGLIRDIKKILDDIPNTEDEYVINRKKEIANIIKRVEVIPKDSDNENFFNDYLVNLKNDLNKDIDCYDRWFAITDCINDNKYFNDCFESLSSYELLEFIGQNMQAPFPPKLSQKEFDDLVEVGISKDERELLWRLAFNYDKGDINLDAIFDYFIDVKDGYYVAELISAVGECLDLDRIFDIDDKDLIKDLLERKDVISNFISEEQFKKLSDKVK